MSPKSITPEELDAVFTGKGEKFAYFFDWDGTLVASASKDAEKKPLKSEVLKNMITLNNTTNAFVAAISGRTLPAVDRETPGVQFPIGACDGRVVRSFGGSVKEYEMPDVSEFRAAAERLKLAYAESGLPELSMVDLGGGGFGIQFARTHPKRDVVEAKMRSFEEKRLGEVTVYRHTTEVVISSGKNNKGTAVAKILTSIERATGLSGYTPASFGNAENDEPAHKEINRRGGISVVIGNYASRYAQYRMGSVSDVHKFIAIRVGRVGKASRRGGDGGGSGRPSASGDSGRR
jgi:trehalose 6-phosphate phosphatase